MAGAGCTEFQAKPPEAKRGPPQWAGCAISLLSVRLPGSDGPGRQPGRLQPLTLVKQLENLRVAGDLGSYLFRPYPLSADFQKQQAKAFWRRTAAGDYRRGQIWARREGGHGELAQRQTGRGVGWRHEEDSPSGRGVLGRQVAGADTGRQRASKLLLAPSLRSGSAGA